MTDKQRLSEWVNHLDEMHGQLQQFYEGTCVLRRSVELINPDLVIVKNGHVRYVRTSVRESIATLMHLASITLGAWNASYHYTQALLTDYLKTFETSDGNTNTTG